MQRVAEHRRTDLAAPVLRLDHSTHPLLAAPVTLAIVKIHCVQKKHPLTFSIITPTFLVDFYNFRTSGYRNEHSTIYLFNAMMTS